jgi:hypothetical protein
MGARWDGVTFTPLDCCATHVMRLILQCCVRVHVVDVISEYGGTRVPTREDAVAVLKSMADARRFVKDVWS